jgi:hypothetical protein
VEVEMTVGEIFAIENKVFVVRQGQEENAKSLVRELLIEKGKRDGKEVVGNSDDDSILVYLLGKVIRNELRYSFGDFKDIAKTISEKYADLDKSFFYPFHKHDVREAVKPFIEQVLKEVQEDTLRNARFIKGQAKAQLSKEEQRILARADVIEEAQSEVERRREMFAKAQAESEAVAQAEPIRNALAIMEMEAKARAAKVEAEKAVEKVGAANNPVEAEEARVVAEKAIEEAMVKAKQNELVCTVLGVKSSTPLKERLDFLETMLYIVTAIVNKIQATISFESKTADTGVTTSTPKSETTGVTDVANLQVSVANKAVGFCLKP